MAKQITNHLELRNEFIKSKKQVEEQRRTLKKVIHDLRTPISGIIGSLSMVDDTKISPELKSVLEITKRSGKNLIEYVNNSLENVLVDNQESDFITASKLTKKLLSIYELQAANKKVELNITSEIDDKEKISTLSSGDLINIIGNLISNAIKFSSAQDSVNVSIGYKNDNKDQYKVVVSDKGTGMTTEQINNIYELRESEATEGTNKERGFGIGLSEALRTLTKHNGTFEIDSEEDRGTRFMVLFPRKH
jgi:signal transduction histidine kinase